MRLIRDDELIMAIANWQQTLKPGWSPVNDTDTVLYNTLEEVAELIESQPTAYDVEAVVRELEGNAEGFFVRNGEFIKTIPLETAIEIVKRGGRNDSAD